MPTKDRFRIRLWAVIGPPNSGKSSVIGALASQTGRGRGGLRDVPLRGGGWLKVFAFRQSLQEAGRTPEMAASKILANARRRQESSVFAYYNVLLALRSDSGTTFPTADLYLAHFVTSMFELQSIVLLEEEHYELYARFGAPIAQIKNSAKMITVQTERNWVFGAVRNHFGWA